MAAVTEEPLEVQDLLGVQRPDRLLQLVNRLQAEAAATLNGTEAGGAVLANLRHVLLADKEVITPDDWAALTPANGFADAGPAGGYGALGVRKSPDGLVQLRETVSRGAGAPALFTSIATMPSIFAPPASVRRAGEATGNTLGGWQVTASGAVQWLFGNPTAGFTVAGSWQAADPTLPAWPSPLRLKVRSRATVRRVFVEARTASGGEEGLQAPCTVTGARIEAPATPGESPVLLIPRVDGLRALTRYRLTILVLVE
jgi:hypothetical protein